MPAHHFASMAPEDILKSAENLNPRVTSGPFMMSESKPGDHYTVVRNPDYYRASQGLPYLDRVIFPIVPDQGSILKNLQAGTADSAYYLDVSKALAYKSLSNYTLVADPRSYNFEALYFNFNNRVLADNREVRQAMAMAVDQQTLIWAARRGLAGPLCTDHTMTQHPGYTPGIHCPRFDLNAANKLLDSHGWKMGADGVRSKDGQRLEFRYSLMADNLWRSEVELINQQNFARIGIKLDITPYPYPCYAFDCVPMAYDIMEFANSNGYDPDDAALFQCDNPANITYYCNPALDVQYKIEQSSSDPVVRQAAFDKIHQIELTDFPFVVEFSAPVAAIHKKGTNNYAPSLVGGVGETENIWLWWCDGGTCP